jgi:effector-binding domain-containing protein
VSVEQVEIFRQRAQQERARAAAITHPGHKAAALKLADQYDAVADSYAKLIELGGSMFE